MGERDRYDTGDQQQEGQESWNEEEIAKALGLPAEERVDIAFGKGIGFRLGSVQPVSLELFPTAKAVRITSDDLQLSLFRQSPPTIAPEGLVFELSRSPQRRWLSLSSQGEVVLALAPDPEPSDISPISQTEQRPSENAIDDQKETKQPRVQFSGRLAYDPRFKTTRSGRLVAEFSIGVKDDDGKTRWVDCAAFDDKARALEGVIRKSDFVDIVGYVHVDEYIGRDERKDQENRHTSVWLIRDSLSYLPLLFSPLSPFLPRPPIAETDPRAGVARVAETSSVGSRCGWVAGFQFSCSRRVRRHIAEGGSGRNAAIVNLHDYFTVLFAGILHF